MYEKVVVDIVEQPAQVNERFRYKCEGKSVVLGAKTTATERSYPAIRILNYTGSAVVVVSCVTADKPYRQHPNNLIGKTGSRGGVSLVEFKTDESAPTVITFKSIGIQCCRKADIEAVLAERERLQIDPFNAKFAHKTQKIDLTPANKEPVYPIRPVVSNVIRDKKYAGDFKIRYMSVTSSPAIGGKEIVIICDKFSRDDIKIRFYRENADGSVNWEAWGKFEKKNVFHQVAIVFETPAYKTIDIEEPVDVLMQLVRLSDDWRSEPLKFEYIPDDTSINHSIKKMKRKLIESEPLRQDVQRAAVKRSKRKMVMNIDPNAESNRVPSASLTPTPTPLPQLKLTNTNASAPIKLEEVHVPQSNFVSNFSCDGAIGISPVQNYQLHQSYVPDERFVQSFHPQSNLAHLEYYSQHHLQSNFLEDQQPTSHFLRPQDNQMLHGHVQHNQMYPQYQHSPDEYQPLNHLNQRRLLDDEASNIPHELKQQSQFDIHYQRQPHQPPQQPQYLLPNYQHPIYPDPIHDDKNLSAYTTCNPLENQQNAMQYNSTAQNLNNFGSNNFTPSVQSHQQEQLVCDSNFNAQEIIENMSGSFSSLVI